MPQDELILELTKPNIVRREDACHVGAIARLTRQSIGGDNRAAGCSNPVPFTAPVSAIDAGELSWYLERYIQWPTGAFRKRAQAVEQALPTWGRALYDAITIDETSRHLLDDWQTTVGGDRRFTILVDFDEGGESASKDEAGLAAARLIGLPWELLHDGNDYVLYGEVPVSVRRRARRDQSCSRSASGLPVRILLVSPRPEDEQAVYIDHRVSALPLVDALEGIDDAELKILAPPTFAELAKELERARDEDRPYHVVHFDGHGAYEEFLGGALCFEDQRDVEEWGRRRSRLVGAGEVSEILQNQGVHLVFLEACHSARADDPTASVAGALLRGGIPSVVAMTHAVLVETARLFVSDFYQALTGGATVGKAVLAGQCALKNNPLRLEVLNAGHLQLRDWFVPVLYQGGDDHRVFSSRSSDTRKTRRPHVLETKLGMLPAAPSHRFVGRSREMLTLERMLVAERYGMIRGLGGEGKTTLAAELARWLVRTGRFEQAAFVSLENVFDVRTFVDYLGRQLVHGYSVAEYPEEEILDDAFEPVIEALHRRDTLVVVDNAESVLPDENGTPQNFSADSLRAVLTLCERMSQAGSSRLLFTSRERLPAPFDFAERTLAVGPLERHDAIALFQQVLAEQGGMPASGDALDAPLKSKALVDAVYCHAHSVVLLAPYAAEFGVQRAADDLSELMAKLHERHPLERERSLFASIELSLSRLPGDMRERIRPLGLFRGGAKKGAIAALLELNESDKQGLAGMLIKRGLAQQIPDTSYLRFHPALSPLLLSELEGEPLKRAQERWVEVMYGLVYYLYEIKTNNPSTAAALTILELPNLTKFLGHLQHADDRADAAQTILVIEHLLWFLGRPDVLDRVRTVREALANKLGGWGLIQFEAEKRRVETLYFNGRYQEALAASDSLIAKSLAAGETAYPEAARHLADAFRLKGQLLNRMEAADAALMPLREARSRYQALAEANPSGDPETLITVAGDMAQCLIGLGRFDEAAETLREEIGRRGRLGHTRALAVARHWLGTAYSKMFLYNEALREYVEARDIFAAIGEPISVGQAWHMIGATLWLMDRLDEAETAYKYALSINVQQKNKVEEAKNLVQLAHLYEEMGKHIEAADLYREAILRTKETNNLAGEGRAHGGFASTLIALGQHDEARREVERAIACHEGLGYAVEPWLNWGQLERLERAAGNGRAAKAARQQATALFLAYRRQGGAFRTQGGKIGDYFVRDYLAQQWANIKNQLERLAGREQTDSLDALVHALVGILDGANGFSLADNSRLNYYDAAEVLWVLERLNK